MTELASGFVAIKPDVAGFGSKLTSEVGSEVEGSGRKIGSLFGKAFAGAGVAAGGLLVAGLVSSINTEAANDKLAAQLGLSAGESKRIGKVAGSLYANAYGDSLEQVNGAVAAVTSSIKGMSTASSKRLEGVTAKALDFATAFDIDVNRAAQIAGQAVKTGLAKNATEAFDLITAASQRVPANLREDVLDAADEYGTFFQTLGFKGKEAFGLLVKGAEDGMYGIDKTGDAIKEFTIRATDMSALTKGAYKTIGIDAQRATSLILNGGKGAKVAFDDIVDGLLGIKDPAKQANTAIALFGTPLEDLNTAEIPNFLKGMRTGQSAMDGFRGSTAKMGDTLNDNAKTRIETFKRTLMTGFVNILGNHVLPVIEDVSGKLRTVLGPAIDTVVALVKSNPAVVKAFAIALGVVAVAIGAVTIATTLFSIALNSTGIPLVIIAIAALVAGLILAYQRSEQFRSIVQKTGQILRDFATWVRSDVLPVIQRLATKVAQNLRPVWEQLAKTFRTDILPAVQKLLNKFREWQPTIQRIIGVVVRLVARWVDFYTTILSKVLPVVIRFAGWIISKAVPAFITWVETIAKIITKIAEFVRKVIGAGQAVAGFVRKVGQKLDDAVGFFTGLASDVRQVIGSLVSDMYDKGVSLVTNFADGIKDKVGDAVDEVKDLAGDIAGLFHGSPVKWGPLKSWNNGGAGKLLVGSLTDGIRAGAPGPVGAMRSVADGVADTAARSVPPILLDTGRHSAGVTHTGAEPAGTTTPEGRRGPLFNIEKVIAHDYQDFMVQAQRRKQQASLGGFS